MDRRLLVFASPFHARHVRQNCDTSPYVLLSCCYLITFGVIYCYVVFFNAVQRCALLSYAVRCCAMLCCSVYGFCDCAQQSSTGDKISDTKDVMLKTHGMRRANAHRERRVRACVRARNAPSVRVQTLAECAACAHADARGVRCVRAFERRRSCHQQVIHVHGKQGLGLLVRPSSGMSGDALPS